MTVDSSWHFYDNFKSNDSQICDSRGCALVFAVNFIVLFNCSGNMCIHFSKQIC